MNTKNETQPTPDRYRQATVTITLRSEGLSVPDGSDWRSYLAGALQDDLGAACDVLEEGDVEWGDWEDVPPYGDADLRRPLRGVRAQAVGQPVPPKVWPQASITKPYAD